MESHPPRARPYHPHDRFADKRAGPRHRTCRASAPALVEHTQKVGIMRTSRILIVAITLAAAVSLSACGGGDPTASDNTAPPSTTGGGNAQLCSAVGDVESSVKTVEGLDENSSVKDIESAVKGVTDAAKEVASAEVVLPGSPQRPANRAVRRRAPRPTRRDRPLSAIRGGGRCMSTNGSGAARSADASNGAARPRADTPWPRTSSVSRSIPGMIPANADAIRVSRAAGSSSYRSIETHATGRFSACAHSASSLDFP